MNWLQLTAVKKPPGPLFAEKQDSQRGAEMLTHYPGSMPGY